MSTFSTLPTDFKPQQEDQSTPAPPFQVSAHSVYLKLSSLNSRKASGSDGIPASLLKDYADLLPDPVRDIRNSSFSEGRLPLENGRYSAHPETKPVKDVNKDLRPISLTPVLSKIAEEFVVAEHVRPATLKKIVDNQFGSIPNSSTTHVLLSMVHSCTEHTDGTGSTVRVLLLDYRKAFDLIARTILAGKLMALNIKHFILRWIIDFPKDLLRMRPSSFLLSSMRRLSRRRRVSSYFAWTFPTTWNGTVMCQKSLGRSPQDFTFWRN